MYIDGQKMRMNVLAMKMGKMGPYNNYRSIDQATSEATATILTATSPTLTSNYQYNRSRKENLLKQQKACKANRIKSSFIWYCNRLTTNN